VREDHPGSQKIPTTQPKNRSSPTDGHRWNGYQAVAETRRFTWLVKDNLVSKSVFIRASVVKDRFVQCQPRQYSKMPATRTSFLNLSKSPPPGSGKGFREDSPSRIVRRRQLNETRCDSCQNSFHLVLNASKKLPFSCLVKRQTANNNAAGTTLSSLVADAVIPLKP